MLFEDDVLLLTAELSFPFFLLFLFAFVLNSFRRRTAKRNELNIFERTLGLMADAAEADEADEPDELDEEDKPLLIAFRLVLSAFETVENELTISGFAWLNSGEPTKFTRPFSSCLTDSRFLSFDFFDGDEDAVFSGGASVGL